MGLGGLGSALAILFLGALVASSVAPSRDDTGDRLSLLQWLPASLLLAMLPPTAIGMLAAFTSTPAWDDRASANLVWAAIVGLPLAASLRRAGQVRVSSGRSEFVLIGLPLAAVAAIVTLQPFGVWARIVTFGTDFERHVVMLERLRVQGWLDYSETPYPRSAHTALAMLQGAAGDGSYAGSWQAGEGLLLAMYVLLISTAGMLAARNMRALNAPNWMSSAVAPTLVGFFMFAGPWLTGNVAFGFLTSVQAGLLIVAVAMLLWDSPANPSLTAGLAVIALCALMGHVYILLAPIIALPTALIALRCIRRGGRRGAALVVSLLAGLLFAGPVLHASVSKLSGDDVANAGGHWLPMLGLGWIVLVALAGLGAWQVQRWGGQRWVAIGYWLMLGGLLTMVAVLSSSADGTPRGSYYWLKTGWTPIGLLLALAIPALLFLALRAGRKTSALVSALLVVGVTLALPMATVNLDVLASADDRARPALSIPVFERFDPTIEQEGDQPYLVWGLMPHVARGGLKRAAYSDYGVQETLPMAGFAAADGDEQLRAIGDGDATAVCSILRRNPDIVRITGPYPDGPLGWLAAAGCPEDVVLPERWISIDVPTEYFQGTAWEGVPIGSAHADWVAAQDPQQ